MSTESMPVALPTATEPWQSSLQWVPSPLEQASFQRLYEAIVQGNQQLNLTRIIDPEAFWEKHLWDSLSGLWPWLHTGEASPDWVANLPATAIERVIDIGTGAGFPALPVAIAYPHWQVALLDSVQKKIRFLQATALELELSNVEAIADRAEFLAHQPRHRESYHLALIRAVGSASTCAEYTLPLLRVGGIAILYRGQWTEAEAHCLQRAVRQLGGAIVAVQPWHTPLTHSMRHCIYLQKTAPTSEDFPRAVGIPAKHPLGGEPR